jgi:hypothetical protein
MQRMEEGASFERCPNCAERPAMGHHLCPLNLEADGCECCGPCAKICSDIRGHIALHTPSVYVDYGTGEMEVTYIDDPPPLESPQDDEDDDTGTYGVTA